MSSMDLATLTFANSQPRWGRGPICGGGPTSACSDWRSEVGPGKNMSSMDLATLTFANSQPRWGPHLRRRANQRLFGPKVRSRPGQKNEIRALEQSDNLAGVVDIDLHESRRRSEPWHRSHLAEDRINETRSDRSPYLPYR